MEGRRGPALRLWRAAGGLVGRGHRQCSRRRAAGQSVRLVGVAAWPGRSALQRSQIMDPDAHPRSCRGVWPCAWQWRRRRAYETRRCTGAITNTAQKAGTKTMSVAQLSPNRSEEHTSELQSLMRISYAVFCLKKKKKTHNIIQF